MSLVEVAKLSGEPGQIGRGRVDEAISRLLAAEPLQDFFGADADVASEQPLQRPRGDRELRRQIGDVSARRGRAHCLDDVHGQCSLQITRRSVPSQERVGDKQNRVEVGSGGEVSVKSLAVGTERIWQRQHTTGELRYRPVPEARNPPGLNFVPITIPLSDSSCNDRPEPGP